MLSLCFMSAFLSLLVQVLGLYGKNGILPVAEYLNVGPNVNPLLYIQAPSIFWLNSSDSFLQLVCIGGAACSALAFFGTLTGPMILVCWFLYLSICTVGRDFMGFQWDSLLLETGLLAAFYAPWKLQEASVLNRAEFEKDSEGSIVFLWLLRLLLFKLMFLSGIVKLSSGDVTWRDLTALNYHYETQPLPTPLAWFCAKLPELCKQLSTMIMFGIELIVPFMIFGIRPMRLFAAVALILLQVLIIWTGNYAFFNWLTIALCILLLDDRAIIFFFPRFLKLRERIRPLGFRQAYGDAVKFVLPAILVGGISLGYLIGHFIGLANLPEPMRVALALANPLRSFNGYGLFAIMTTSRPEIVIEGSMDGKSWVPYEFKFKPGGIHRAPPLVAPHQPRMDWQMWFASLAPDQVNPWFLALTARLLQGSPEVLALFERNPFPDGPPKIIRANIYDYHFSDYDGLFKRGEWWTRKLTGTYMAERQLGAQ